VAPTAEADEAIEDESDPFDPLLEHISRDLLDDAGEKAIARAARRFGELLEADRVVVNQYDEADRKFSVMTSWLRDGTRPLGAESRGIAISELPWAYSALSAGETVVISDTAELPADAGAEKALYGGGDVKSSLLTPMVRRDMLTGFVSIQSARDERDWTAVDVGRARKFVMLLTATLARDEAEAALAAVREEAEEAAARISDLESRLEEAESSATEAGRKIDDAMDEMKTLRTRLADIEEEAEQARSAEKDAREAAREATEELEKARDEAEDQLQGLRREAERAQQRSDDVAAEALTVREELDRVRAELEEALRDAEELRADAGARRREREAPEPKPVFGFADDGADRESEDDDAFDFEPAAARERKREDVDRGRSFDPDATLEMDSVAFGSGDDEEEETEGEAADRDDAGFTGKGGAGRGFGARRFDDTDAAEEGAVEVDDSEFDYDEDELRASEDEGGRSAELDGDAARGDADLEYPQKSPDAEGGPSRWKDDKASWEDSTDEVDLPKFLGGRTGEKPADEVAADDDAGADDDVDVWAARDLARQIAGKGKRDDEEESRASLAAEELADEEDDEDADEQGGGDFFFQEAWRKTDEELDAFADLDTEPPSTSASGQVEQAGESDAHDDGPWSTGDDAPFDSDGQEADESAEAEVPDLAGIDAEVGLQDVGGNVELYRSLLGKFRSDYIGAGAKIESAIEKGNIEMAHLLLHAVKGVAGVLGALRVRDTADELETKLIGNDPEDTRAAARKFSAALGEVLDAIAEMQGESAAAEPSPSAGLVDDDVHADPSDPMVLRSYLSGLRQHLMAEKKRQCQLVMREITARTWPEEYRDRVDQLAEQVDGNDFEGARGTFEDLMSRFVEH
jgi:HPt (histidine-containing phosphotransfer) domain-containing protein/predicted  nucleic acid-binding Zn-ribbon protein